MSGPPALTIVQATNASLEGFEATGLFERHRRLLQAYAKRFAVTVYSADVHNYSAKLGVAHRPVPWLPRLPGLRHLVFYLWLVWCAPRMAGVIKVFGSSIPTLPLVRRLARRPLIVSYGWNYADGTRLNARNPLRRWLAPLLERLSIAPADEVEASAPWLAERIRTIYHKPVFVLPGWVDLRNGASLPEGEAREPGLILYAGRLDWIKGLTVLLDAYAQVRAAIPAARLVICGTGDEGRRLQVHAQTLGLAVEFRGRVPNAEVLDLMRRAGLFVLPTLTMEGQPKALIEAMYCGAACVASNVPGNRELVSDGQTGRLVPPGDAAALAATLLELLGDPALCVRLGSAAKSYASQFDFERVLAADLAALEALA